jgi:hypothetical protein
MTVPNKWALWFSSRGKIRGVAIVYRASDYGLELKPNGLSESDRIAWCEDLCLVLNARHSLVRDLEHMP